MEQLLTIAIPTYNRPEHIQNQVRLILPQLNKDVCLVVYDNCSQNPVKDLFTENELSLFTIIRNRMNVGGDANIARCFENCTTAWLWTLSDDDYVKANAVEIALTEINQNFGAVFINFWSDPSFKTIGFEELTYKFRNARVYSNSFTMSNCAYNMSKLRDSLQDYYNNLSSMTGTIILVLKYVQKHNGAVCVFPDKSPINIYNTEVGWNYGVYIRRTKQFMDTFKAEGKRNYNRTLFIGYNKTNYLLIVANRKESKMSYLKRWRAFRDTINNQGIFNAMFFTPQYLIYTFFYLIFQHKWLNWIVSIKRKIFDNK